MTAHLPETLPFTGAEFLSLSFLLPATDSKMNGIFLWKSSIYNVVRSKFSPTRLGLCLQVGVFPLLRNCGCYFQSAPQPLHRAAPGNPSPQPVESPGDTPWVFLALHSFWFGHSMSAASSKVLEVIVRCFVYFYSQYGFSPPVFETLQSLFSISENIMVLLYLF